MVASRSSRIVAVLRNRFLSNHRWSVVQVTSPNSVPRVRVRALRIVSATTVATRYPRYLLGPGFSSNPRTRFPGRSLDAGLQVKSAMSTRVVGLTPNVHARGFGALMDCLNE